MTDYFIRDAIVIENRKPNHLGWWFLIREPPKKRDHQEALLIVQPGGLDLKTLGIVFYTIDYDVRWNDLFDPRHRIIDEQDIEPSTHWSSDRILSNLILL